MFNALKNKILKLLTSNYDSEQLILNIFAPLARLETTLPKRILYYIKKGDDTAILVELQRYTEGKDIRLLMSSPGAIPTPYYNQNDKALVKSVKARKKFYSQWTATYSFEQIIRFGKVLASIKNDEFVSITPKLPLWFLYLFSDGLVTTILGYKTNKPTNANARSNWSITQLHELLETEEKGLGKQLLFAIFDRQNLYCSTSNFDYIFNFSDLLTYVNQHIELFKELPMNGLSAMGQLEQLDYIQKQSEIKSQSMDLVVQQAISGTKKVSELATAMLVSSPFKMVQPQLQFLLTQGTPKQRSKAAALLSKLSSESLILEQALASETNNTVTKAIETALSDLKETSNGEPEELVLITPEFEPILDTKLPPSARDILQQNYDEQLAKWKQCAQFEIESNKTSSLPSYYRQQGYDELKSLTTTDLDNIFYFLNGEDELTNLESLKKINLYIDFILTNKKLQALPEFNLFHLLRINKIYNPDERIYEFATLFEDNELIAKADLRQIAEVLSKINYFKDPSRQIATVFLTIKNYRLNSDGNEGFYESNPDKLWPFFAENMSFLDEAFGLIPAKKSTSNMMFEQSAAINILKSFPQIPTKYVSYLLDLALGENESLRYQAQDVLNMLPDIHLRVEDLLLSTKQEFRILAAQWLANLGQKSSIEFLTEALKKEKREIVQAAILTALETLGDDISNYLTEERLLNEAQKGLKVKRPAGFEWFDEDLIPQLTWFKGGNIPAEIIQWWVRLAYKLKDPVCPLFLIYTKLLSKTSQQQLGQFILESFIKQDTLSPTLEEAELEAKQNENQRLQQYLDSFERDPVHFAKYENITLEAVSEEIKREVLSRYIGSAINSKGLLSLASGIKGKVAVSILQNYMRDHYTRRYQIEAMLEVIASNNDPLIIQFLLSIARRHRTNSVQEKAISLVNNIAERNHWTSDELADRTISTAGLDETGVLSLNYGKRTFIAIIDDKLKLILKTSEGKDIKTLPEVRKNDDENLVKEARKQLANSKKELKQILDAQIARLYEAMCSERRWSVPDWKKYLHAHPIMNQLIQHFIWLEVNDKGEIVNSFRPNNENGLINLDDDEILINDNNFIMLVHSALLTVGIIKKWQNHLKTYKVSLVFSQLDKMLPEINLLKSDIIDNCNGCLIETYTLRDVLTELGYKHTDIKNSGWFNQYYKYVSGLDIYINIKFSGNAVPEKNIPAVIYDLHFSKKTGWDSNIININHVPPVLLAEGYADYMAVANSTRDVNK